MTIKLDYSLKTPEERAKYIQKIMPSIPKEQLTKRYLNYLGDYILLIREKGQTKGHQLLTKNRETIIKKREKSYEDIVNNLEGGEDALHALINNDKNQLLDRKEKISEQEALQDPALQEKMRTIQSLKKAFESTTDSSKRFKLKQQIIETGQEIYIIKASYKQNTTGRLSPQIKQIGYMDLKEEISVLPNGQLKINSPLTLLKKEHVSFLLNYYPQLKQEVDENLNSDLRWLLIDLENLIDRTFLTSDAVNNKILYDLIIGKTDGLKNKEIVELMRQEYGVIHSEQYYSTLWRKKIPNLLAKQAQKEGLIWNFSQKEYGLGKKCSKCGKGKVAHPLFYDRSSVSSDKFYSQCKECRAVYKKK